MGNQSHQVSKQGLFQRPAHYVPEATLMQHVRERVFFPSNALMASARSLHTFNRGKQLNCNLHAGLSNATCARTGIPRSAVTEKNAGD